MTGVPADSCFSAAVAIVLEAEGVFADQAGDRGGETRYGIARNFHPGIPWPPTKDQATAIYRTEYWDVHRCGEMPWPWALVIFDAAVNQTEHAVRLAQRALGTDEDGIVGAETLRLIAGAPQDLLLRYMALRAEAYMAQPMWPTDGAGWLIRLFRLARAMEHAPQ
jgi:lysozyme family protein